mmetsp:Transcript_10280/g.42996  ORF Transcript_10280/g.42996 Transcript_10280/m.42996 type:complete len:114 (-) Transcript_10280:481-822(-)
MFRSALLRSSVAAGRWISRNRTGHFSGGSRSGMKTLTMGSLSGKSRLRRHEVMIQKRWGGGDIGWVDEHGNEFYMNPLEAEERVINVVKWFEKVCSACYCPISSQKRESVFKF